MQTKIHRTSECASLDVGGTAVNVFVCAGCNSKISDRYYLTAASRPWHVTCLRCCACAKQLDPTETSYARNDKLYCSDDFRRLFMVRDCAACFKAIQLDDMVVAVVTDSTRRHHQATVHAAGSSVAVYHVLCFRCVTCIAPRTLQPGEQFGIDVGRIYCRAHFCELKLVLSRAALPTSASPMATGCAQRGGRSGSRKTGSAKLVAENGTTRNAVPVTTRGRPKKTKFVESQRRQSPPTEVEVTASGEPADQIDCNVREPEIETDTDDKKDDNVNADVSDDTTQDDGSSSTGACGSWEEPRSWEELPPGNVEATVRRKRMRSSFKHHQLKVMKAYFQINHNPDGKELREMSMKTGLLTRVIQVWFQNARAKFRRNLSKQNQNNPPPPSLSSPISYGSEHQLRRHHIHDHPHYDEYHPIPSTASTSYRIRPDVDILPGTICPGADPAAVMTSPFGCRATGCRDCVDSVTVTECDDASGFVDYGVSSSDACYC